MGATLERLTWHIWEARNRKLKSHTLRPPETVTKVTFRDTGLSLKHGFHKKADKRAELQIINLWKASILR